MKPCRPVPRLLLLIGLWLPWPALASGAAIDTVKLLGTWQALESHPDKGQVETLFTIRDDRTFSGSMSVNSEIVWTWGGDWTLAGNRDRFEFLAIPGGGHEFFVPEAVAFFDQHLQ